MNTEQKRIMARAEALLRQRDALEAQLRQTRTLGAYVPGDFKEDL